MHHGTSLSISSTFCHLFFSSKHTSKVFQLESNSWRGASGLPQELVSWFQALLCPSSQLSTSCFSSRSTGAKTFILIWKQVPKEAMTWLVSGTSLLVSRLLCASPRVSATCFSSRSTPAKPFIYIWKQVLKEAMTWLVSGTSLLVSRLLCASPRVFLPRVFLLGAHQQSPSSRFGSKL